MQISFQFLIFNKGGGALTIATDVHLLYQNQIYFFLSSISTITKLLFKKSMYDIYPLSLIS